MVDSNSYYVKERIKHHEKYYEMFFRIIESDLGSSKKYEKLFELELLMLEDSKYCIDERDVNSSIRILEIIEKIRYNKGKIIKLYRSNKKCYLEIKRK